MNAVPLGPAAFVKQINTLNTTSHDHNLQLPVGFPIDVLLAAVYESCKW